MGKRKRKRHGYRQWSIGLVAAVLVGLAITVWLTLKSNRVDAAAPLKGIPIHVMEFHIWWDTPFYGPDQERVWSKWNDTSPASLNRALGPSWRRDTGSGAMPLIGCYNSANPDVIRWQLRCAKAAGITALQISLFPNQTTGLTFGREKVFADIVRMAGEEEMPVYIHDEVQFRQPPATRHAMMTDRLVTMLSRYATLPGYYKIDGKPVVSFQYWHQFIPPIEIDEMASSVNRLIHGGVHFIVNGQYDPAFGQDAAMGSFVALSNSVLIKQSTDRTAELSWRQLDLKLWKIKLLRLERLFFLRPSYMRFGLWAYPGFDDTKPEARANQLWFPRGQNDTTLRETLRRYAAERPDFILLSSWNDWQENSAIEPALNVDGFNGDPYQALRTIAELQGKTFTPPPLPPAAAMDPWLSAQNGGPDLTPPRLAEIAAGKDALRCTLVDETSPVEKCEVARVATQVLQPKTVAAHGRSGADLSSDLEFKIESDTLTKKVARAWLAVTIWDGANDVLKISYPALPSEKLEPTDEDKRPRWLTFPLRGEQRWRTMVFPLEDLVVTTEQATITFRALKSSGVLLTSASIFCESDFQNSDATETGASADRHVVTAKIDRNSAAAAPHLLIGGHDVKGNAMLPVAVDLGGKSGEMNSSDD